MKYIKLKIALVVNKNKVGFVITLNNKLIMTKQNLPTIGKVNFWDKEKNGCPFVDTETVRTFFKMLLLQINLSISPFFQTKVKNAPTKKKKKEYKGSEIKVTVAYLTENEKQYAIMLTTSLADSINTIPFINGEPKITYTLKLNSGALLNSEYSDYEKDLKFGNIKKDDKLITKEVIQAIETGRGS